MNISSDEMLSVTDAGKRGMSSLVNAASEGHRFVVMRNNKPAAVITDVETVERLDRIDDIEEDLRLLSIAVVRSATGRGERRTLEDVAAEFDVDLGTETDEA